jgi:hypothetical protein
VALRFTFPTGSLPEFSPVEIDGQLKSLVSEHKSTLQWLTAFSVALFIGSIIAVPWLVARIPTDYFIATGSGQNEFRKQSPTASLQWRILKNVIGVVLLVAGAAMLILPGQGLLTILLGVMLVDFPGKRRLELLIIRRPSIRRVVGWIRRRTGRDELQIPGSSSDSSSE